ncbi:AraC family transcriptional regulator [Acinetobacter sp. S40]|uniref:AraC family transcriptional regulator n=1 Tax=Acinetobacter sp. S40 TaxID=2767434 RepID=UPI00190B4E0A|nr:AraC family transcriptional regulator [Acinetobacter sp. S40]MBJ9984943.1 AraC family transcriptional regulator [Acinetobacter sp. S40]
MDSPDVAFWSDPRMPYVETRKACQSRICYKAHSHATFSIGAVDQGQSRFSSYLHTAVNIESGSIVSIPAYIEHSCNPLPDQAWSYQMMHLSLDWLTQLFEESIADRISSPIPELRPEIIKDPEIYQYFCQLNNMLFDTQRTILEKEQYLVEILNLVIFPSLQLEPLDEKSYLQQHLRDLVDILFQHESFLSLEQLSNQSGISRYAIIRLFKRNFGLTPHAFQLNLRINQARELLKKGKAVVDIAYDLGFTDQSHFHRVFKSLTGVTPRQYQNGF